MLSTIAVIASLLMLGEGAIEIPLNKITNLPRPSHNLHSIYNPNSYSQNEDMDLDGGLSSVHRSYIAEVTIGDKNYKLIADTGSSDLLVVGDNCVTYERQATCDPRTAPVGHCIEGSGSAKSQSGTYTGKEGKNCYGTPGSITFAKYDIYKADVTMAGVKAHDQYLGYIHQQAVGMWGKGENAVDGILGLAYDDLSSIFKVTNGEAKTLMTTLSSDNKIPNALAMCFDPSGKGGKMIIGGGEIENMEFTPLVLKSWYTVTLDSMSINGRPLRSAAGLETIVDSGTTNLIVPGELLDEFASILCPLLGQMGARCFRNVPQVVQATPEQIASLPNITISLPGATLVVPPESYFTNLAPGRGNQNQYVYGINSNGYYKSPKDDVAIILGDVALMGYWVYFDTANARVGFSSVKHCDQKY